MNMEEFKKEIIEDEGVKHEVYLDHLAGHGRSKNAGHGLEVKALHRRL
jgi:hypothetical protein